MKRFWIMLLVMAVAIVIALPVGAVPPKCVEDPTLPGCSADPDDPTAARIAVSMDSEPVWVHEGADLLRYTVTLENKTGEGIAGVDVEFSAAGETNTESGLTVAANGTVTVDGFSRYAWEFPVTGLCPIGEECELTASATVSVGGEEVTTASMSTPLLPDPPCDFAYHEDFASDPVLMNGVCIWTLPDDNGATRTGVWEITLEPTPPNNPNRPIGVSATVRDGVPGNWCSLAVGIPSAIDGRWKVGDDPIVGEVYLPGDENISELGLDEGMCLNGGAGGDYFAVGNPKSFYLSTTDATVTVKWIGEVPEIS